MPSLQLTKFLWACSVTALLASPFAAASPYASVASRHTKRLPAVFPPPQQISASGCGRLSLSGAVTIVTGTANDATTIDVVKAIVSSAGGKPTVASQSTGKGTQILIGSEAQNSDAAAAAKALTGNSSTGLTAEGYVLGSGLYKRQPTVVLNGVDTRGTFYAAQTLRQLVASSHKGVPAVEVRDWPLMPLRGSIEGFYGFPWSHQARLDQFVFYGKHKMNTYIYTPKDDAFLRANWRDAYNSSDLALLQELVDTANANQVDFTFALSPGLDLCYSSDDDLKTTMTKFDQIRNLGVHSFYIALDDIPTKFHCDSDTKKWPPGSDTKNLDWLGEAQAYYLNRVQKEYIKAHNLNDLQTVPTNYAGSGPDPYKKAFGTALDKDILIQWTGEGVFSPNVTVDSVTKADTSYVTDKLYIWDNFPVNDGMSFRLFLNPLIGRAGDLYKHLQGFTSNPMVQSYASMPALGNYGDYLWNGPAYDATASMAAVLSELAGPNKQIHDALVAFADLNQNWPYRTPTENATLLSHDIVKFWASRRNGDAAGAQPLKNRLALINKVTDLLPQMAMKGFATDSAPWLTLATQWATATQHLIAMLAALDQGDKNKATTEFNAAQEWVTKTKAQTVKKLNDQGQTVNITPTTGDGVFDAFLANATAIYNGK